MDPFQRDFEDEYALHEMIQEGTQTAGCFQEDQNEDDGSQYLNDTSDGDAKLWKKCMWKMTSPRYMEFDHRI